MGDGTARQDRIPLCEPDLRGREGAYLAKCVADNWISSAGAYVTEFERRIADISGRRAAIACVNGTAALHLALVAQGIGPGDRVVVPDWTFAASANAIRHAGAEPVFCDVLAADWCLDPASAARAIELGEGRVKAILAVDVLGNLPDPGPLTALAAARGVALIEDAAGAIGAARDGVPAGALGAVSTFSFNGNKLVTAGGGGMLVTDDEALAARLRHLSTQARVGTEYLHDAVGFNYRMTNVNAAIGVAQMERLYEMLAAKRRIAGAYRDATAKRGDLRFMPASRPAESSYWLASVTVADEAAGQDLVRFLDGRGVTARTFWRSLSRQAPYADCRADATPVSLSLSGRVVSLPCSSSLTDDQLDRVTAALGAWQGPALEDAA